MLLLCSYLPFFPLPIFFSLLMERGGSERHWNIKPVIIRLSYGRASPHEWKLVPCILNMMDGLETGRLVYYRVSFSFFFMVHSRVYWLTFCIILSCFFLSPRVSGSNWWSAVGGQ